VGFVGASDGWTDFAVNGQMSWTYDSAGVGNVALIGEAGGSEGVLALAFGSTAGEAQTAAADSLGAGFDATAAAFTAGWTDWAGGLRLPDVADGVPAGLAEAIRHSAVVIRAHEDRVHPGAFVASLSVPWGDARNDLGGYHLVWPRDAVESGLALAAAGQSGDATRLVSYLADKQRPDGHWAQNFYPDGTPFWDGVQLDETAFPILLVGRLSEDGIPLPAGTAEMVRRAAAYLAANGPMSPQDRWEENPGGSPFTMGVMVAALVVAAGFLPEPDRAYALALADNWNQRIEEWTYVEGSDLDRAFGVTGHYVRIGPTAAEGGLRGTVPVRNQPSQRPLALAAEALVGMEFLYLVRLGLRTADDPRIRNTLKVAEGMLGKDTPAGRAYYRYNQDGYGEWVDGSGFAEFGIGRLWPLLAGERGHYAALAGEDPAPYLAAMLAMRGRGQLLPEQVWDTNPVPWRGLWPGQPTNSAMPLVWAHSELIKLVLTARTGRPTEQLTAVAQRYRDGGPAALSWYWRDSAPVLTLPRGRTLVVEDRQPFTVHLGYDGWQQVTDRDSAPIGLGRHGLTIPADELDQHARLDFVRRYPTGWEAGPDHHVNLTDQPRRALPAPAEERRHRAAMAGTSRSPMALPRATARWTAGHAGPCS
jgi:glucoamylase